MRIPINWLKDYIEIEKTPDQLADDLSLFGHEVDSIDKVGSDVVLDFEITPNRGDCLSILGMAREAAALYQRKLKKKDIKVKESATGKSITVTISDPNICPRFTGRIIDNIKITESPKWMQERLIAYGFRPINNIVDITNYVMVETGQPLHAFDYNKIKDGVFNIRQAKQDEEVVTLDGQNRKLQAGTIIIEDNEKIYDLAAIMGGAASEVDENTRTIVLVGSVFDPVLIRKASKYLRHSTESSYRYERGVDPEGNIYGVDYAASLIGETVSEAKIDQLIDKKSFDFKPLKIEISNENINHLLGTELSSEEICDYLARLNIKVKGQVAIPPSYRTFDIKIWQDVAEEVGRLYGFNNIAINKLTDFHGDVSNDFKKREYIKDYLAEFGFIETSSYSFADKDKIELLGFKIDECLEIANPLSPQTQYLRPSILPTILNAVAKNPWAPEVRIFEIEKVFDKKTEKWQLGMATAGKDESILRGRLDYLKVDTKIQSVDQSVLEKYKIRRPVKYVIADIDSIKIGTQDVNMAISNAKYIPISKFPPTIRDFAFVMSKEISNDDVASEIAGLHESIFLVEEFDCYLFEGNEKSVAYHVWMQALESAMDPKKVSEISQLIIDKICTKFKAKLRS